MIKHFSLLSRSTSSHTPSARATIGLLLELSLAFACASPARAEQPAASADAESPAKSSERFEITGHYVHGWLSMPKFTANHVMTGEPIKFSPKRGQASVIVFLASWCLPCQQLIGDFKKLEQDFAKRHTNFVYVFAHDTIKDAQGFAESYKLGKNIVMANHEILDSYHQPELPTVYVGDRHTWMTLRLVSTTRDDLAKLDEFLKKQTSL